MRKVSLTIKTLVVLGITFCFIGVNPVSATRATTNHGAGCFVRVGTGDSDYVYDSTCTSHAVLKMDDDGTFDFYVYQDHGQLPEGSWRPSQPYRDTLRRVTSLVLELYAEQLRSPFPPAENINLRSSRIEPDGLTQLTHAGVHRAPSITRNACSN